LGDQYGVAVGSIENLADTCYESSLSIDIE